MRARGSWTVVAAVAGLGATGLGATGLAGAQDGPDHDERTLRADLDGDGTREGVLVRPVRPQADFSRHRVTIVDPDTGRSARVGPVVDRFGRVAARDFAGLGDPQVFAEGSSGASGGFYSVTIARWTGTRQRVLFRYESGTAARGPAGAVVVSARLVGLGPTLRLREFLAPPEDPSCCPSSVRVRTTTFRYSAERGRYLRDRRVTGPPRDPRTL